MDEPRKETPAHATPGTVAGLRITPELMQALAGAFGAALGEQAPAGANPGPAETPVQLPGPLDATTGPARAESGWKSRKLWMAAGTLAGMFAQLPVGMVLPLVTQIIIGAVVIVYIIIQGIVDYAEARRPAA
jgi:hypothetical protein